MYELETMQFKNTYNTKLLFAHFNLTFFSVGGEGGGVIQDNYTNPATFVLREREKHIS